PGSYNNPPPARSRKLLLHKHGIRKLIGATAQQGLTLIPLELYFKDGLAKVAIALGRAKKLHDKREDLRRRAAERELARAFRGKDRKSTRLNSSHVAISYAVFCLKK